MIPTVVADLLRGWPEIGAEEQAFPFVTVDEHGFPHVALLSRSEMEPGPEDAELLASIGSPRTRRNLVRDGRAGLVAVQGQSAHYLKLRATRTIEMEDLLGCALAVAEHKEDSLGIPLQPITFVTSDYVERVERWDASARVLRTLAEGES